MSDDSVDLLVIGGGINGAGVARDAAGRGLSTLLVEKDDLAQHTSSASTKLIHGGLRYLEHYDFGLVRHALKEREVLLRAAPHIIWPLRFLLPHHKALRPKWMIRMGLFLYDHLGGRKLLPASRRVAFERHASKGVLQARYTDGFEYSDCWVQDARLVVLNAMDAKARGAEICTRTQCIGLRRESDGWRATLHDRRGNATREVQARAVVNASGPWVEKTLDLDADNDSKHGVRLVKGSHIVVRKLFEHPYAYIFQNADGRVLFAVPFENDFTLLGTTDVEESGDPGAATISDEEVAYICTAVSEYLSMPVSPADVVWTYTGVRPLYDDASKNASKVTRDYVLQMDRDGPPVLSVFGGKITTFRRLAEEVVDMVAEPLGHASGAWTADTPLPGGDIANADFDAFLASVRTRYPWLPDELVADYARNYGTRMHVLLDGCAAAADLGEHFGGPLYEAEVRYLVEHEWAESAEDILWRRSKKGLRTTPDDARRLADYLTAAGIRAVA